MEIWLIFAFASMTFAGLNDFLMKVIASEWYNRDFIFFIRYVIGAVIMWIIYVLTTSDFKWIIAIIWSMLVLATFKALLSYAVWTLKVKALENVDTTLFFPLSKTLTSILVIIVSMLFLHENLSLTEIIWIILSFFIPFLLLNKAEKLKQKDIKKGLIFIWLWALAGTISTWISKYANILELNIELFALVVFILWAWISYIKYSHKKKNVKYMNKPRLKMIFVSIFMWIFFTGAAYSLLKALSWNLAVAHTIRSFSILIPIILSVIFYKEEMTKKKAFVIFLSIVSVILFI